LIAHFGVVGAAFGILVTYLIQALIRTVILHFVFHWPNPWHDVLPVTLVAFAAIGPATICRMIFPGVVGQLVAALYCLAAFATGWLYYRRSQLQPL
jgi:hypothetical protein